MDANCRGLSLSRLGGLAQLSCWDTGGVRVPPWWWEEEQGAPTSSYTHISCCFLLRHLRVEFLCKPKCLAPQSLTGMAKAELQHPHSLKPGTISNPVSLKLSKSNMVVSETVSSLQVDATGLHSAQSPVANSNKNTGVPLPI